MNRIVRLALWAVAVTLLCTTTTYSQETAGGMTVSDSMQAPIPTEMRIYQLKHIHADDALPLLKQISGRWRIAAEPGTNSLVIVADEDTLKQIEQLIASVDVPQSAKRECSAIIKVGLPENEIFSLMDALVSHQTKFGFSEEAGLLTARGPCEDIDEVKRVIKELEAAVASNDSEQNLQVTFHYLQGTTTPDDQTIATQDQNEAQIIERGKTEADRQVWRKLLAADSISATFEEAALEEVFATLSKKSGVNIVVNWSNLESYGIDRDLPVSIRLSESTPFANALEAILQQIDASKAKLGYAISNGVVSIASEEMLQRDLYTKVYSVDPNQASEMLEIIYNTVAPRSWSNQGGPASAMANLAGQIIVTQCESAHYEIELLLDSLSKADSVVRPSCTRIPPAIEPAVASLEESGFYNASLIASLSVLTADRKFKLSGKANLAARELLIIAQGQVERVVNSDNVNLSTFTMVQQKGRAGDVSDLFTLDSRLAFHMGDYVVLAASPSPTGEGQAIALVVTVKSVN